MTIADPKAPRADQADLDKAAGRPEDADQWTAKIRNTAVDALPPQRLLPDRQPAYVASWIYVFGVTTICALLCVIVTGFVLAVMGPNWWHVSSTGLFVNSLHLWSVEVFMFAMVDPPVGQVLHGGLAGEAQVHLDHRRGPFLVSVGAAFTGYLSQQNFDSQWISTQAKDGINSTGAGAIFNVTNFGQMIMWHIVLLPLCVIALVGIHVLMVRLRGVVTPFAAKNQTPGEEASTADRGYRHERRLDRKPRKFVQDRDAPDGTGATSPTTWSRSSWSRCGGGGPRDRARRGLRIARRQAGDR